MAEQTEPVAYKRPDITERLALYWRTYADLSSLALHPETPGYTHGMLIGDTRDARLEIERLRVENENLRGHIRRLVDPYGGEDDDIRAARMAIGMEAANGQ